MFDFEDVRLFAKPVPVPPFWVRLAGVSYCDATYFVAREHSEITVMEYIVSGTGTLTIGGETLHPSAGDVYILPKGSTHRYAADSKDPWVKIFINVCGTAVPSMLQGFGLQNQVLWQGCQEMYPIFSEMFETVQSNAPADVTMEKLGTLVMKLLWRLSTRRSEHSQEREEAEQLKEYIDANFQQDLTMDEIAGAIYRSNDYANKLFKRRFGITPYAYYIELKVSNAKALLQHTSLSIGQIAERLGYQSTPYFCRQFRRTTGMTASQFRACFRTD